MFIRTCSDAMENLQLNNVSQAQTINLRHKFEILLNQVKDFDTILLNISDTSEIVIIIRFDFKLILFIYFCGLVHYHILTKIRYLTNNSNVIIFYSFTCTKTANVSNEL